MSSILLDQHADAMKAVKYGYSYPSNLAEDLANRIDELQTQLIKALRRETRTASRHEAELDRLQARAEAAEAKLETARNEALEEAIAVAGQYLEDEAISMTENNDELAEMKGRLLAWIPAIRAMMEEQTDD